MLGRCFCHDERVTANVSKISNIPQQTDEKAGSCPQLTHSPRRVDVDAEPGVSADPRGRQIPGGKLGPYPGLSARHLFSPEAAAVPLLPHMTGGAATPVTLLFLPVHALRFRWAGASCSGRRRGARGGSTRGLGVRVRTEALHIDELCFLLVGQLELSERLLWAGVGCCFGDVSRWR